MKLLKTISIFLILVMITSVASAGYGDHYGRGHGKYNGYYDRHDNHRNKHPNWHDRDWKPPCPNCGERGCRGYCEEELPEEECPDCGEDCEDGNCEDVNTTSGETSIVTLCRDNVCSVGGGDEPLQLTNYADAKNPTYAELLTFLKADKTDERPYTSDYVCADFSVTLHDNAEKSGIKAGWVGAYGCNHAVNVFETTDKGTVYIDCTGQKGGGKLLDAQVNCVVGQPLTGNYLFRDGTVDYGCKVTDLLVYW